MSVLARTWLERQWRVVALTLRAVSAGAFLGAVVLHPLFISSLSSDGELQERTRLLLYVGEGVAALAGVALWRLARATRRHTVLKEQLTLGILVCLASVVVGAVSMEGALRLVHAFGTPIQTSRHYFFSSDPLLGWRHRSRSVAMFKDTRVNINSAGLRDDEIGPPKDGTLRIMFLGDSQIFGDGVSHEETFVELLQSQLAGIEPINAGVIGYGTDQQLLYYERDGSRLHPNVTIVGLNAYDLRDNISTQVRSGYQKPVFELRDGALELTNVPVDPGSVVDRAERWLNSSSQLYATATRLMRGRRARTAVDERAESGPLADVPAQAVFPSSKQMPRALEVTRLILARLAADARNAGGRFAVMFLPYRMNLGDDPEYEKASGQFVDALKAWGASEEYAVLDLRDVLRMNGSRDSFLDAMHFSPAGHQLVAHATREWLLRTGLVPQTTEDK